MLFSATLVTGLILKVMQTLVITSEPVLSDICSGTTALKTLSTTHLKECRQNLISL